MASGAHQPARPLQVPTGVEATPLRTPAGRVPLMAFVLDAATDEVCSRCLPQMDFLNPPILRGGIEKAIQQLSGQRSPTVLIVDISGVELPVSRVHALAEVCEPGVTVIVIGDHNDVGLYRDLLQAGVSDYVVKPLTPQLLAKALGKRPDAGEAAPISQKRAKMIALTGARGGVGTTTFAVSLAWHLAERQKRRVALVDLDMQYGDCAYSLNLQPTHGLREALMNPLRIDNLFLDRTMAPYGEYLFVLSCEEPIEDELQITPDAVETLISGLWTQFHYVILDVPRNAAPPYRKALDMADLRIIVADQTLRSLRDTLRLRRSFPDSTATHRNLVVVNRHGESGRRGVTLNEMNHVLETRLTHVVPFEPKVLQVAANGAATPAAGRGKFADAIAALALELSGRRTARRGWSWKRGTA